MKQENIFITSNGIHCKNCNKKFIIGLLNDKAIEFIDGITLAVIMERSGCPFCNSNI